ncbi:ISL3 family transposase [Candidatus Mycolicibacterium alkanivorans]|uniref:ISL3 family transposase n=1 Tax=Candidatus Mycolicibacterium alkanivorans TaxID=2954114 RepID=A0ABS9YRN1_9MYCO|nr:ISL3 family transposase [Candidatus Mycolicibacterium alkanivorans]MCI4673765.1 ISL3 family transposase [Candidatus Mycolicibacterium alkanivorans]MCI4673891.1 ISL3 family transposase [Candidatus Mycolicibacterium alkanivorans]
MRASTLLNSLLGLSGVRAGKTAVCDGELRVTVSLRRRRLCCPQCSFSTGHRYDTREVDSSWRHLDMGGRICRILLRRRRLRCPDHGVLAEGVPFARPDSRHTRDFEDLVAWLVTKADKTTVSSFARVAWRTVGAICERVVADVLDPDRLCGLVDIGVDEISWRKHHRYLTLVSDHDSGTIVWGKPGKDTDTLGAFFDELPDGGASLEAVSMDMGPAYAKAVRERAPAAVICFDPFHVVKVVTDALEAVRRQVWQAARTLPDQRIAKTFKGARWALLKNPADLTDTQAQTLREMKRNGGILWRAYQLKEALREVFAGDLDTATVAELLNRWCARAQRSRIPEFIKAGRTIRKHRAGIDAALERGLSNGRHEGLNTKVRLLIRRAYGFHSAKAALALILLACGPVTLKLPYHTGGHPHSCQ